jgi:hypothetical protein
MTNYIKTTDFAAKDSLPSGNAAKIVKGTEIDAEFNNIAIASATKANKNNSTLTGTTVFETLSDGTIAITGWVDEDNMASNSAVLIPTQQSVKAYVDSNVTAQDLDVTDGTTSIDIDLDSESLGILGGTGVTSTASGTGVTLAIDSTVATLTGTQTLSNKTLTTPVISGALTTNSTIDGRDVAVDGTKLDGIESGATADQTAAEIKTAYESNANTNAFTDADESKLDGIEALADVTDTANVTAAGALMDSELTNITAVKALNQGVATTDSPTFATVNAPLTGNVTGNLTGSVLTAAQTNITSVGTLTGLTLSGTFSLPNANATNEISFTGTEFTNVLSATTSGFQFGTTGAGYLSFLTNNTERMRLTAAGDLYFAQTSGSTSDVGTILQADGRNFFMASTTSEAVMHTYNNTSSSGAKYKISFQQNGTQVGVIEVGSSSTGYITSSDYRLKENVVAITGATERLKQLNPSRFNFIADANTTVDGFLAHEVQDIVPEAISGTKDAMRDEEYEVTPAVLDDDGNVTTEAVMGTRSVPDYQGIDQSKLVPLLVATIQELEARLTALENN